MNEYDYKFLHGPTTDQPSTFRGLLRWLPLFRTNLNIDFFFSPTFLSSLDNIMIDVVESILCCCRGVEGFSVDVLLG